MLGIDEIERNLLCWGLSSVLYCIELNLLEACQSEYDEHTWNSRPI